MGGGNKIINIIILTFLAQICLKMDLGWKLRKLISKKESACSPCSVCPFLGKQTTSTFLAQISSKMDLGLEIQKANVGIRIIIHEILCVLIFKKNGQLWNFPIFPITCDILVLIVSRVLKITRWRLKWAEWRWVHGLVIPWNSLITHQGLLYGRKQFCSGGNH